MKSSLRTSLLSVLTIISVVFTFPEKKIRSIDIASKINPKVLDKELSSSMRNSRINTSLTFVISANSLDATQITISGSGTTTSSSSGLNWSSNSYSNQLLGNSSFDYVSSINYSIFSLTGSDLQLSDGNTPILFDEIFIDHDGGGTDHDDFGLGTNTITAVNSNTVYTLSGSATFSLNSGQTFADFIQGVYNGNFSRTSGGWRNFDSSRITIIVQLGSVGVNTLDPTNITQSSVDLGGAIFNQGESSITEKGILFSITDTDPQLGESGVTQLIETDAGLNILETTTSLTSGTTYYYRAYATNSEGTGYGEVKSVTLFDAIPTLTTADANSLTGSTADLPGAITNQGNSNIIQKGILLSTTDTNPQLGNTGVTQLIETDSGVNILETAINLEKGITYYYRSYATNSQGTGYGSVKTFMLSNLTFVISASSLDATQITISGSGGATTNTQGVTWVDFSFLNRLLGNSSFDYVNNLDDGVFSLTGDLQLSDGNTSILFDEIFINNDSGNMGLDIFGLGATNQVQSNINTIYTLSGGATFSLGTGGITFADFILGIYAGAFSGTFQGWDNFDPEGVTIIVQLGPVGINTLDPTNITQSSVDLGGTIFNQGESAITEKGILFSATDTDPLIGESGVTQLIETDPRVNILETATSLAPGTTYYYRAYATNSEGTGYGEVKTATIFDPNPTLITADASNLTDSTADLGGTILDQGNSAITEKGILFSTTDTNPQLGDTEVIQFIETDAGVNILETATSLEKGITYYYRSYALNSQGIGYGSVKTFVLSNLTLIISANSLDATQITISGSGAATTNTQGANWSDSGATNRLSGNYSSFNYVNIYNTSGNTFSLAGSDLQFSNGNTPILFDEIFIDSKNNYNFGLGATNQAQSNLNTIYTLSGSATFSLSTGGTFANFIQGVYAGIFSGAFGGWSNFDSSGITIIVQLGPVGVNTLDPTNITQSSADLGGTIFNQGNSSIIEKGILFSTTDTNPLIGESGVTQLIETDSGVNILETTTSLTPGTIYYYRAYATNSEGTGYGEVKTVTIFDSTPTLTTTNASNLTDSTADLGGTILDQGNSAITEKGVLFSATDTDPQLGELAVTQLIETDSGVNILETATSLEKGITYYYRSYATNSQGTSYGSVKTFALSNLTLIIFANPLDTTQITLTGSGAATTNTRGKSWNFSNQLLGNSLFDYVNTNRNVYFFTLTESDLQLSDGNTPILFDHIFIGDGGITNIGLDNFGLNTNTTTAVTTNTAYTFSGSANFSLGTGELIFADFIQGVYAGTFPSGNGGWENFDTLGITIIVQLGPVGITSLDATNITQSSVGLGGTIFNQGESAITEKGILFSATDTDPLIGDTGVTQLIETDTGVNILETATSLTPGATYYYRAYATNSEGTGYGEVKNFTTSDGTLSIDQNNLLNQIKIYSNQRTLRVSGMNDSEVTLGLYNLLGQKILETSLRGVDRANIPLPNLRAGMYIVFLQTSKGEVNRKIIIE